MFNINNQQFRKIQMDIPLCNYGLDMNPSYRKSRNKTKSHVFLSINLNVKDKVRSKSNILNKENLYV